MPTFLTKLPYASADAAGLTALDISETQRSIFNDPRVQNWWRADTGFSATGWRCRKTDTQLTPARGGILPDQVALTGTVPSITVNNGGANYTTATVTLAAPPAGGVQATAIAVITTGAITAIKMTNQGRGYTSAPAVTISGDGTGALATASYSALGGYNGQMVLQSKTGQTTNGELYGAGLNLLPINTDFSVVVIGRPGPSDDTGFLWGNPGTAGTNTTLVGLQVGAGTNKDGTVIFANGGAGLSSANAVGANYNTGPIIHVTSWADSTDSLNQQISPGNYTQTAAMSTATHNTLSEFHVLGAGLPTPPSASYQIEGGDVGEVFICNVALHLSANADLLALIRTYMGARYGKTVP